MTRKKDVTLSKTISKNIKKYREKMYPGHGGQGECIAAYGASRTKWSNWELGKAVPTDPEQRKLAAFFGISMSELRGEKLPPPQVMIEGGGSEEMERLKRYVAVLARLMDQAYLLTIPEHRELTEAAMDILVSVADRFAETERAAGSVPDAG